jgi:hypothetical protein
MLTRREFLKKLVLIAPVCGLVCFPKKIDEPITIPDQEVTIDWRSTEEMVNKQVKMELYNWGLPSKRSVLESFGIESDEWDDSRTCKN